MASLDVEQSNKHPLGQVLSKLAALGEWKEKFPAYRGSVVPTHFQKQVSWGTWLAHIQFIYKTYKKTDVFISEDVP